VTRIAHRALHTLVDRFIRQFPQEVALRLESSPAAEIARLLAHQSPQRAASLLARLSSQQASEALAAMGDPALGPILAALPIPLAARLLSRFDEEPRRRRLALLDDRTAREIEELIRYPSDAAGWWMDPRVMTLKPEMTVREALKRIRASTSRPRDEVFLVDEEGRFRGVVALSDLAASNLSAALSEIARPAKAAVNAVASREEVVELLTEHRLTNLPVVDVAGRLLGVIRHDALVAAAREEASADLLTMVGASKEERALSRVGFAVRKRLPWLEVNLLTAFLAASVVGIFEDTIARNTALAVLLPVVAGQSGNTGAQALAVTMRGLALREVRVRQWLSVLFKEIRVGFLNGLVIALTTSLFVYFWSSSPGLSLVIGTSMVLSMAIAGLAGGAIPLLLTTMGQDPAQSSSIILTTVTDVVGFFSFLGIATLLSGML
jgi:magnesium transporter